jgi:ubiquinone/menaquinone biosynthesis C-methylase UbiE
MKHYDTIYWDTPEVFFAPYNIDERPSRLDAIRVLKSLNPTSIFSVGCGCAPEYPIIKREMPEVKYKGTDYSKNLLKLGKQVFPDADLEFQDARKLKEKDNSWDVILCFHALDNVGQWQTAIPELFRVTKKHVVMVLWRPFTDGDKTNINQTSFYRDSDYKDTWLNQFSKEELEGEFKKAGFEIEEARPTESPDYNFLYVLKKP